MVVSSEVHRRRRRHRSNVCADYRCCCDCYYVDVVDYYGVADGDSDVAVEDVVITVAVAFESPMARQNCQS